MNMPIREKRKAQRAEANVEHFDLKDNVITYQDGVSRFKCIIRRDKFEGYELNAYDSSNGMITMRLTGACLSHWGALEFAATLDSFFVDGWSTMVYEYLRQEWGDFDE